MKGLTLTQPWASLVALGAKRIETRSWGTAYRGWLAIHAARTFPREAKNVCVEEPFWTALRGDQYPQAEDMIRALPLGAVVAMVRVVECFGAEYAWRVDSPEECYKWLIDCRRGFFGVPAKEFKFGDFSGLRHAWVLADVRALREPIACRGALGLWDVPADVLARIRQQGVLDELPAAAGAKVGAA